MPVVVFGLFFVFQKIHTKRSPNATKLFDEVFWNIRDPRSFVGGPEEPRGGHNPPGRAWSPTRGMVGCAHLEAHLSMKPTPKIPINIETPKNKPRPGVPPPQASLATKDQSGAHSGTLTKEETPMMEETLTTAMTRMTTKIPEAAVVPMTVRLPFRMWGRRLPMQRAEILSK